MWVMRFNTLASGSLLSLREAIRIKMEAIRIKTRPF
jgi:hypothetical protein